MVVCVMNKKKPDALLILAVIFGLGILISTLTYGDNVSGGRDAAGLNAGSAVASHIAQGIVGAQ
jgi:hypothetical protein|tara:strand:+ start:4254 stop:4445 length:192 start_codon:yes stop_codon:yes gene_type:complete